MKHFHAMIGADRYLVAARNLNDCLFFLYEKAGKEVLQAWVSPAHEKWEKPTACFTISRPGHFDRHACHAFKLP